jgi:hypothetical protein
MRLQLRPQRRVIVATEGGRPARNGTGRQAAGLAPLLGIAFDGRKPHAEHPRGFAFAHAAIHGGQDLRAQVG